MDFYSYSFTSLTTINNSKSKIDENIPLEYSYLTLQNTNIFIDFEVTYNVIANTQHAIGDEVCFEKLKPIALFSDAKLATSSNKHLEKLQSLYALNLLHMFLPPSASTAELFFDLDNIITHRRQETTTNKQDLAKGSFYNGIRIFDFFWKCWPI